MHGVRLQDDSLDGNGQDVHVVRCGGSGEIGTAAEGIDQCVVMLRGQVCLYLCRQSPFLQAVLA